MALVTVVALINLPTFDMVPGQEKEIEIEDEDLRQKLELKHLMRKGEAAQTPAPTTPAPDPKPSSGSASAPKVGDTKPAPGADATKDDGKGEDPKTA